MRTAYFWFTRWPEAQAALPPDAERVYTGPGTHDYWHALAARWNTGQDLVVIEQDVIIHDQVIPQFAACPEPWCSFAYEVGPGQHCWWWLGCTRFSAQLQAAVPLTVEQPGECLTRTCGPWPCHRHMDVILQPIMRHLGQQQPHQHEPDIRHLR